MDQRERDNMDRANLAVSAASLVLAGVALCLNEKNSETKEADRMTARKRGSDGKIQSYNEKEEGFKPSNKTGKEIRKDKKSQLDKQKRNIREYAVSIGYNRPVICLSTKEGKPKYYELKEIKEPKIQSYNISKPTNCNSCKGGKCKSCSKKAEKKSWVAIEYNFGANKASACVCGSKEAAIKEAQSMKRKRNPTSRSRFVYAYAYVDPYNTDYEVLCCKDNEKLHYV